MKVEDKYLPDLENKKMFLVAQINERKKIVWRYMMDLVEAEYDGEKSKIISIPLTIKDTCERIDIYQKELDKLGD